MDTYEQGRPSSGSFWISLSLFSFLLVAFVAGLGWWQVSHRKPWAPPIEGEGFLEDAPGTADIRSQLDGVAIVEFWATWCPPCTEQTKILNRLERKEKGLTIVRIDYDRDRAYAKELGVNAIPTIIVAKDGREKRRYVGLTGEAELISAMKFAEDGD